jgi:CHAT domain-containing protein/Tfp pilus assembly protein PilF
MVALLAAAAPIAAQAQGTADLATLNNRIRELYKARKYGEAIPLAEKSLELTRRQKGENHIDTTYGICWLATLYKFQGRYAEGLAMAQRCVPAIKASLGENDPQYAVALASMGELYSALSRYAEAEPLLRRALEIHERVLGSEHNDTLSSMNKLAVLYHHQGRNVEAETLLKRALESRERTLGPEHPETLALQSNLAKVYQAEGRYAEAEPLFKRALGAYERTLGKEHRSTLTVAGELASLYEQQGRYEEAEPLVRRALAADERLYGADHPDTLTSLTMLASLFLAQGRLAEAEPLYQRTLTGYERLLGKEHRFTITAMHNLASLYQEQRRYAEAEPLYKRALELDERTLGAEHPDTLEIMNSLATLYQLQGRNAEAEPLVRRALNGSTHVLGKDHPITLSSLKALALVYIDSGRCAEAVPLLQRALESEERVLGPEHPETLRSVLFLGGCAYAQKDWGRASQYLRRSTAGIAKRTMRDSLAQTLTGKKKSEAEQWHFAFLSLVRAEYHKAAQGRALRGEASQDMFEAAQWALSSEAAASLAQMAARGARRDPALAEMVRQRQDLLTEWQRVEAQKNIALGQPPKGRDAKSEAENNERLATIDARITEIDKQLAARFPDYGALTSPAPASVSEVQAYLNAEEALVLFFDAEKFGTEAEELFVWAVTKTDVRWVRADLAAGTLTPEVQALRCGLDAAAWEGRRCAELTGHNYTGADLDADKPLPFDHTRAYKLYQALFGQVEDLIKGRQLLVVPSGPLTQLPFQVLVKAPPANGDNKSAAWLIRDHAITVLPAVSSLKAVRRVARPSTASKPLIGFGNPLLDGPSAAYARFAQLARDNKTCTALSKVPIASATEPRGLPQMQTRGGFADGAFLRKQAPLPETADELCAVARDVHADTGDIYLGARATERQVKRLSETGDLAKYRIVHFATHGALAGQVQGNAEPGLLLTPPEAPSEEDDGYLTASEVAGLKLDADWVILSACNTAAGGAQGAEALSGLARAFIYAQARALLVSHWAVNSDATVKLITGAISRLAADKSRGRAEAMRQSMLALIDTGGPREAQPAYWAPFVLVGDGGTMQ